MDESNTTRTRSHAGNARPGARGRALVGIALVAFVLGAGGMWYLAGRDELHSGNWFGLWPRAEAPAVAQVAGPVVAAGDAATAPAAAVGSAAVGGFDQRITAMEQRLAQLDLQAQAAAGNVGRAEGLLVVFAARRAIDRGAPLGYLEDQLRLRFGDAQPNAVRRIVAAGKNPLTVDQLVLRLDGLSASLAKSPRNEGFFDRVGRELGQLFVVRRDDTPSPAAQSRLERAHLFLESGRFDAAIAEVRMLPNASAAADWLSDADRFATAQRDLDQLESFALLEPRTLRDGAGEQIQQPSPVVSAPVMPAQ